MAAEVTSSMPGDAVSVWVLPHRSLSRAGLVAFLVAQAFAAGVYAGLAAWQGNVLAPVFAVFELAVVSWCMSRVWLASGRGQIITLTPTQLVIAPARGAEPAQFHPYWVRLRIEAGRQRGWPSRLLLGSHGREVEVGKFLNEEERRELAQRLTELLRPCRIATDQRNTLISGDEE